jgi:hypothetical protein
MPDYSRMDDEPDFLSNRPQFVTDYEPGIYWNDFFEFKESLEEVLERSLERRSVLSLHMTTPYPWLEIVLIFISTTSATAVITKLNEDIYEFFKSKLLDRRKKGRSKEEEKLVDQLIMPMKLRIEVKVKKTLFIHGDASCDNYQEAIDALSSIVQMFEDAKAARPQDFERVDNYTPDQVERMSEWALAEMGADGELIFIKEEHDDDDDDEELVDAEEEWIALSADDESDMGELLPKSPRVRAQKPPLITYIYDKGNKRWTSKA